MQSPVRDTGPVTERNGEAESPSVRISDIRATLRPGYEGRKLVSPFEPHVETIEAPDSQIRSDKVAAPEKKITLFALRLAILEKAASGLGTLAFFWATVVLLGGFAVTLKNIDFWFVTIILLTEGARIFSRSRELEWQHETTLISAATLRDSAKRLSRRFSIKGSNFILIQIRQWFMSKKTQSPKFNIRRENSRVDNHDVLKRTWSTSRVQLVPYTGWLSIPRNASRMLFWLQLVSASACVALSLYRLESQDFGVGSGVETRNRKAALDIFYGLSLAEALLFLLEKAYWQWKIVARKLLTEVNNEYGFSHSEYRTVRRFFYDTYSQCVNGSVFDGLKMDFVSYSVELLQSSVGDRQLTGARVLCALANNDRFADETLRTIGTMRDVVERLIEMLNWKNYQEQAIRRSAAEIICKLVKKNRNRIRVTAIAGSMESIASLLYDHSKQIDIHSRQYGDAYDYSFFSLLGLRILESLANDHDNCAKIGSSKGLLPKIIGLTELNRNTPESEIKTAKLALQLLGMLASSTGSTGKALRKGIWEIVFAISNLRDVLQYGEISTPDLKILAIDILTSLALEEEGREIIGSTGGVLRNLLSVFFSERININITGAGSGDDDQKRELLTKAGEALALLSLESKQNCRRMMSLKLRDHLNLIASLISVLQEPVQGFHAARILRNLCAYAEADYAVLREIAVTAAQVLESVMTKRLRTFRSKNTTHVFAASDRPTVIYSSNRKLLYSNVNLKEVNHMCPFNSVSFPDSLAIAKEDLLTIGSIDDIQKLHIRAIPLGEHARRICHQEQSRTFAICSVKYCLTNMEETETHFVRLLDDQTFEMISSFQLDTYENGCSILSCSFTDDNNAYYCVGTAYVLPEENEPSKGRILVFSVEDGKLLLVTEKETKGSVYNLNAFNGKLLAGINQKIQLYKWVLRDDGSRELQSECGHHGHILALYVQSRGDFIVVGDLMKSISLLIYKHEEGAIEERARDYNANWMTAVEILDDDIYLGAENNFNLFTVRKNSDAATDEERGKLEVVGEYHLGEFVNLFRHGSLVMRLPDSESSQIPTVIFGTVNGVIGVIASLPQEQYQFLEKLQTNLVKVIKGVGGLSHEQWRSFSNERKTVDAKNFLDGDLIESFLDLSRNRMDEIATAMAVPVEELCKRVEEMTRLH